MYLNISGRRERRNLYQALDFSDHQFKTGYPICNCKHERSPQAKGITSFKLYSAEEKKYLRYILAHSCDLLNIIFIINQIVLKLLFS